MERRRLGLDRSSGQAGLVIDGIRRQIVTYVIALPGDGQSTPGSGVLGGSSNLLHDALNAGTLALRLDNGVDLKIQVTSFHQEHAAFWLMEPLEEVFDLSGDAD